MAAPKPPSPEAYAPLTARILAALKSIPRGAVAAYGDVARMAGNPRAARQVVRILNTLSKKEKLPWHRIVNRNMQVSLPMDGSGALQARLLRKEGWRVDAKGRIEKA
jgi:methylated-DNA-protein-cysteine methyltransferase-like protein